jgi:hypothetical protein
MVERPHQFLVVENRLGFVEWCTTAITDGSTDMKKGFYETTCRVIEAINPSGYLSSELHRLELFLYAV